MVDLSTGQAGQGGAQVGGYTLEIVMISFFSIALYNFIELIMQISIHFKRRRGLYFWSMIVATTGIPIHVVGFIFKYWVPQIPWEISATLMQIGWVSFVTGQSMLLYSRLHLVLYNQKIQRAVLAMIIFDGIVLHTLLTVMVYGSQSAAAPKFLGLYSFTEKLQMTWFSLQEAIISGIYVWAITRLLLPARTSKTKLMRHLIYVNIFVVLLDVVLLGLVYSNQYELETSIKPGIYSVKLKLEFAILNQLLVYSRTSVNEVSHHEKSPAGPRHPSTIGEGPRQHVFTGSRQPSHAGTGIMRTTTIQVGDDDKDMKSMAKSPSQEPIIQEPIIQGPSPVHGDGRIPGLRHSNTSDDTLNALPHVRNDARRSSSIRRPDFFTASPLMERGGQGQPQGLNLPPASEKALPHRPS